MKKISSLIVAVLCACTSLTATASTDGKFVNPITITDTISGGGIIQIVHKAWCDFDQQLLPQDTTMLLQGIHLISSFSLKNPNNNKWTEEQKQEIKSKYYDSNMLCCISDVYNHNPKKDEFNFNKTIDAGLRLKEFGRSEVFGYTPEQGGHYNWIIARVDKDTIMSGKIIYKNISSISIKADDGTKEVLETQTFDINSKIKSGFPYNIEHFQGKVHYKVIAPDSTIVCEKDVQLNASSDSILMEYRQEDNICRIENAKKGIYTVELTNVPWIEEGKATFMIMVVDPFMGAKSDFPREITQIVKNSTFKENLDGWKYEGTTKHTIATNDFFSAVMIGSPYTDPKGQDFCLEQTLDSIPAGWYTLEWKGYYQPGEVTKMNLTDPVLGEIFANDNTKQLCHVYDNPDAEDKDGFVHVLIPYNADAALKLNNNKYQNNLTFEQKTGGPLTIGARAQASSIMGATTLLGRPKLTYYGEGKAYGKVEYRSTDTIFVPKDTIKYCVTLFDGVGVSVPDSNKVWIKVYKSNEFKKENLVLDSIYTAAKAGEYNLEFGLPDTPNFTPGTYYIEAGTLHDANGYWAETTNIITLKFKEDPTAIKEAAADPLTSNNSKRTYDLSGRRINAATTNKGSIYINSGKKIVK